MSVAALALADGSVLVRGIGVPAWLSGGAAIVAGTVTALVLLTLMLAAGWFGGRSGGRYHREADTVLLSVHEGGLPKVPQEDHQ